LVVSQVMGETEELASSIDIVGPSWDLDVDPHLGNSQGADEAAFDEWREEGGIRVQVQCRVVSRGKLRRKGREGKDRA